MMGKRVNFAARSVISPDVNIGTDEVGVPVRFAVKLSYPEPVNKHNREKLADMVRNGADTFPGARMVEVGGKLIDLTRQSKRQRADLASKIVNNESSALVQADTRSSGKSRRRQHAQKEIQNDPTFLRMKAMHRDLNAATEEGSPKFTEHLQNGDVMLANRQPTLHKPSLMAHKVRVINNKAMQTF